jgi:hypothetical protein
MVTSAGVYSQGIQGFDTGAGLTTYYDFQWGFGGVGAFGPLGSLNTQTGAMLVFMIEADPNPGSPQPTSADFGGNACTIGPFYHTAYHIFQTYLLPVTAGMSFSVSPHAATQVRLTLTYPGTVSGFFGSFGEMISFTGVDSVATLAFPGASTESVLGTLPGVCVWTPTNTLTGATGDCLVCSTTFQALGNAGSGASGEQTVQNAGYTQTPGAIDGYNRYVTTAFKVLLAATTDTITWQTITDFHNFPLVFIQLVLKALSGPPPVNNPSFTAPATYMVQPGNLTFVQWASKMNLALNKKGGDLIVSDESQWKSWASRIVTSQSFSYLSPPIPGPYTDWRAWARDLLRTLSLSGF